MYQILDIFKEISSLKDIYFYSFQKGPSLYDCHFRLGGGETPEYPDSTRLTEERQGPPLIGFDLFEIKTVSREQQKFYHVKKCLSLNDRFGLYAIHICQLGLTRIMSVSKTKNSTGLGSVGLKFKKFLRENNFILGILIRCQSININKSFILLLVPMK